ncbi:MAG: antiactivator of flagellar biosynthesis FleN protein [Undibacterium sp.]|nr:antiactivator of flagellar biosynthesis FleN protein [Undibacterium sp.]
MANIDQAEGLRRLLERPKLRVLTFLSNLPEADRNGMLINLSATLARQGKKTLMVDAKSTSDQDGIKQSSLGHWLNLKSDQTLLDVVRQQRTMDFVVKQVSPGLSVTKIAHTLPHAKALSIASYRELAKLFDLAASKSDVVVVDCELNGEDQFVLSSFDDSEIMIQVSNDPDTIKSAYGLIKRINHRMGRREFGIVVTGVKEEQAQLVFANLSKTAKRYLAVELNLVGVVPEDAYLRRATQLGRSVIDAFPLSKASQAFGRMADRLFSTAGESVAWRHPAAALGAQLEY